MAHLIFDEYREDVIRKYPSKMVLEDGGKIHVFDSAEEFEAYRNGAEIELCIQTKRGIVA